MRLLTDADDYGLRAMIWLAQHVGESFQGKQPILQSDAAPAYLIAVLQSLAPSRIRSARHGSRGGFTLEAEPAKLTIGDVLRQVDSPELNCEQLPADSRLPRTVLLSAEA